MTFHNVRRLLSSLSISLLVGCTDNANKDPFIPSIFAAYDLNKTPGVKFDKNGIPLVKIWSTGKYNSNPTNVAQWGIGAYDRYYTSGSKVEKERVFKAADWLLVQQRSNGGFPLLFDHDYPDPRGYHLKAPWYSAVTQGNAMSLLMLAYAVSGNSKYKDAAIRGLHLFTASTADGGLAHNLNGSPWYEETPDPKSVNHIFNGFVFSLIGIDDVYRSTDNGLAEYLWKAGEKSLRRNLHLYNIHSAPEDKTLPMPWSIYDLQHLAFPRTPTYLTDFYMGIHIKLMQEMYQRTGRVIYKRTADQWAASLAKYETNH